MANLDIVSDEELTEAQAHVISAVLFGVLGHNVNVVTQGELA